MKILIPVLAFSPAGGMRVLSKLSSQLIEEGHEVDFLGPHFINEPYYPTEAKIRTFRNYFHHVPVVRGIFNLVGMFLFILRHRKDYDVFLANYNLTAFPVALGSLGSGKGFYYIQAYEPEFYNKKSAVGFLSYLMASLSYFLPLKRIVNGAIYKNYKLVSSQCVVEPGIDLETYVFTPKQAGVEEIVVGCIGRELAWKGTYEIIEAVKAVREATGKNLVLNVAFELPKSVDLVKYDFVRLTTPHGDKHLAEFYRCSDLFIATGLIQDGAFHYPCLESLASGCIVISNYGPANNDNALFINVVTKEKIAEQIMVYLSLREDELASMRTHAKSDVKAYGWSAIAKKMLDSFALLGK
ncbi:glycosyltransferase family 4 protein [Pseudomonas sp. TNT3]|uniref:glycosyltransferase family 4 protein n=1 Tax=Pseudomonas sp. TNT3 TaxID=2654097 RepID=UPI0013909C8B|nr:glycosyltransferase family 4 protein [Pseudomonas sp. TNT3]KAI2694273.1 glycosyltransferase family 4 protein [Pseudomonas sp. TNT3]